MFKREKEKLLSIIWLSVGGAILSSIFSSIIISYVVTINKKINRL
ncbi:hypothetical protein [Bacillus weihaiensis]|nr:hypothetical protein [Bacillus weihaiensis]